MAANSNATGSKRWTYFHSALQLAIQRAAHKWTYEEFAECFPSWCKEQPDAAIGVYNTISRHMESCISDNCEALFEQYHVQSSLDILHEVIIEARSRNERGETGGQDVWRDNLSPRAATRARTTPILEAEVLKLRASLQAKEGLTLQAQTWNNVQDGEQADAQAAKMLDVLDDIHQKWSKMRHDEIGLWTLQTTESLGAIHPP